MFGKHAWDVRLDPSISGQLRVRDQRSPFASTDWAQLFAVIDMLYQPFVWFIKLPLFLLILEVFGRLRWVRFWAWGGILFTGLFSLGALSTEAQICAPSYNTDDPMEWLGMVTSVACLQNQSPSYQMAAINLVTDVFILILPLPAIWSLNLQVKKKVAVSAIFMTGLG